MQITLDIRRARAPTGQKFERKLRHGPRKHRRQSDSKRAQKDSHQFLRVDELQNEPQLSQKFHPASFLVVGGVDQRGGVVRTVAHPALLRSRSSRCSGPDEVRQGFPFRTRPSSGGSPETNIRGQRSPQSGRKPFIGAETWTSDEGRRGLVAYEPPGRQLGA